jgi:hypothetical protein
MARDLLQVWLNLDRIHCYDEGDGWGSAEPYLWTVFFKIDGDGVALTEGLTLSGTGVVRATPGSHGNLGGGDVDGGEDVAVPSALGQWSTTLKPIPVPPSLEPLAGDDLGGVVGVACVLMEEDNVTDAGAEAGHAALNVGVQAAIDDIIATRTFTKPDIDDDEIDAYMDAIQSAVEDAIQSQQNFFEDIWSWLNKDDLIGSRVFRFKHDELAEGNVIDFSQRWEQDGDWEIFGSVNASVLCPAEAAAGLGEIVAEIFKRSERSMRSFRDREFAHASELPRWWALAERNAPQLLSALSREPELQESAAALMQAAVEAVENRDRKLPDELFEHADRLLTKMQSIGSRRTRMDASRTLAVLQHLRGKTGDQAIELFSNVAPSRTPRPRKDVGHLLVPELRPPRTMLRPRRD